MFRLGMDSVVRASLGPSLDHPRVAFGVCSVGGRTVGRGAKIRTAACPLCQRADANRLAYARAMRGLALGL